jgi:hypothetical protein
MKRLTGLLVCLLLLVMVSSTAFATPIATEPKKYTFYFAANSFSGGDIDHNEIREYDSAGMGLIVPISDKTNIGFKFGSSDYSSDHFAMEGSWFEDNYIFRLNYSNCGDDGSLTHLGVYRDGSINDFLTFCGGGGASFVSISGVSQNAYLSLYIETQLRLQIKDGGIFGYVGASYEYHLKAFNAEIGIGMRL